MAGVSAVCGEISTTIMGWYTDSAESKSHIPTQSRIKAESILCYLSQHFQRPAKDWNGTVIMKNGSSGVDRLTNGIQPIRQLVHR